MSLILSKSQPKEVEVKTGLNQDERGQALINLGSYMSPIICIPMDDFVCLVEYVLTNTDVEGEKDPRIALVEKIKQLHLVPGYNKGAKRFDTIQSG